MISPEGKATIKPKGVFLLIFLLMPFFLPSQAFSKREHLVYFPNTAYELNIYKIYGKSPGKTLMLVGGIQGNEPGGFLSADLYADMSLEKGNLIVVPRANFNSIILNTRGANGDMNRKFTPEDVSKSMEDKIVTILKGLISESDYLLNLHDGAGYFHPKYINKWRNPMRFGQTIIADCPEYRVPGTDRVIKLEEMAERVIEEVNPHIENDLYKFHFMNTRTADRGSPHQEQMKSATYYALTRHHIPAFGVETSKFLPSIDLKVRYHNLVINAFKRLFGIIPESPGLILDSPVLKYLVVSVNGRTPILVQENQTLQLERGDSINVTHIESNYERGLSLDILGYGGLNDYRKDFAIFRNTTLIVRKDNHTVAEIPIKTGKRRQPEKVDQEERPEKLDYFIVEAMGHRLLLANGETLHLVKGDKIKIVDVLPSPPDSSGIEVNFKGFVGDRKNNTGEDRGYVIDTGKDLIKRFSLHRKGKSFQVVASRNDHLYGRLYVELAPPKLDYVILKVNSHKHVLLKPKERVSLSPKDEICLEEIRTNLSDNKGLHLHINGHKVRFGERTGMKTLYPSPGSSGNPVQIKKDDLILGEVFIHVRDT
jgi:hypothetical protein